MGVSTSGPRRKTGVLLALLCASALVGGATVLDESGLQPIPTGDQSGGDPPELTMYDGDVEYSILLSESVTPGQPVTVTVVKGGQPVEGVVVTVNGDRVGRTDEFGRVNTTVPFAESLTVSAQRASARSDAQRSTDVTVLYDRRAQVETGRTDAGDTAQVTRNESLSTTVDITPVREPRPGASVTLVARIDGVPVPNATVRHDGRVAGQTDANGRVVLDLPWNTSTSVRVTRGSAAGTWQPSFAPLQLSVKTRGPLPVAAGLPVGLVVTQDGRPVDGATVRIAGDRTGQTGAGGLVEERLPRSNSVSVTVARGQMTTTKQLTWLYLPYLLVVLAPLVAGGGLVAIARRRPSVPPRLPALLPLARRLTRTTLSAVVRWFLSGAWLRSLTDGARRIAVFLVEFGRYTLAALGAYRPSTPARDATATPDTSETDDETTAIRAAFDRVCASIPGQTATLTPAEIRHKAVEQGLPDTHVDTIVDAFRSVTYGQRDPAAVTDAVRVAAEALDDDTAASPETEQEDP